MRPWDEADVTAVVKALHDEGAAPGSSIHSWRCEYPDAYGPCDCLSETARVILDALNATRASRVTGASQ